MRIIWKKNKQFKKMLVQGGVIFTLLIIPAFFLSGKFEHVLNKNTKYLANNTLSSQEPLNVEVVTNFIDGEKSNVLENTIIQNIKNSTQEIDIAMYSFNIPAIRDALYEAAEQGVQVNLFYSYNDSDGLKNFFAERSNPELPENFHIQYMGTKSADESHYSMHHKFMIIDPHTPNQKLFTGPWNWTVLQEELDPNYLVITTNSEIIESYLEEIQRLKQNNYSTEKFKDLSYKPFAAQIDYANQESAEVWWSPGRNQNTLQTRIVDLINSAQKEIKVGVTVLDSKAIAESLIKKAEQGVNVTVIVDQLTAEKPDSNYPWLKEKIEKLHLRNFTLLKGGKSAIEGENYSIFHYHLLIIDNKITLTTTANWTYGGFFLNDENTLIFDSPSISEKFLKIYQNYLSTLA